MIATSGSRWLKVKINIYFVENFEEMYWQLEIVKKNINVYQSKNTLFYNNFNVYYVT